LFAPCIIWIKYYIYLYNFGLVKIKMKLLFKNVTVREHGLQN
jgi:hypothetical protein